MKRFITLATFLVAATFTYAQSTYSQSGQYPAINYGQWSLELHDAVAAASAAVIVVPVGTHSIPAQSNSCLVGFQNGKQQAIPLSVGERVQISDGSNSESSLSITALSTTNGICTMTVTFANAHGAGAIVRSASNGLDEAINDLQNAGGGVVAVGAEWYNSGGTAAIISGALPFSNVSIADDRYPTPQNWNIMPATTSLLAAPTVLAGQVACDSTHQFCSDTAVAGSANWSGTIIGCYTLVDINGNESPCSATNSYTSVVSKAIDMGVSLTARTDNVVGWKPYSSLNAGSYALSYSWPLLTQPTALLAVPVSSGVCTLTTLETVTPACAIANSTYGQAGSIVGKNALFNGGAQFTTYPVVTNTLAPEIGSVSALAHNPNEEAHATYAYVPGNRVGAPGIQTAHILFPVTAAAQNGIGEVEGSIPIPANFLNYIGRTIEVCGLIAKTSTTADTVDKIQIWYDAEGSNVTAGTPVQLSSINITEATALAAAANFHFCQQLTTTVAAATATGGTIQPGTGYAAVSQTSAGANPSVGSSSLTAAVGSLNLALPAHLSVELVHSTGTDGAGSTLQGASVRVIN